MIVAMLFRLICVRRTIAVESCFANLYRRQMLLVVCYQIVCIRPHEAEYDEQRADWNEYSEHISEIHQVSAT